MRRGAAQAVRSPGDEEAGRQAGDLALPAEASARPARLRSSAPPSVFGRIVMPLFLRKPYANHARAEELIRPSGLDFTVVRPVQLVDGPTNGKAVAVSIGAETLGSLKVARSAWPPSSLRSWPRGSSSARCPCCTGSSEQQGGGATASALAEQGFSGSDQLQHRASAPLVPVHGHPPLTPASARHPQVAFDWHAAGSAMQPPPPLPMPSPNHAE